MSESRPQASFATTHWSLVLAAGKRSIPESSEALAALCSTYWPAVYAYVRRRTPGLHEAQDLTQSFFARLLENDMLAVADPSRGRFRSFLLTSLRNFLNNEWDRREAVKRGGGCALLPLNFGEADSEIGLEPVDGMTPDRLYERRWALALLDLVMTRLRGEYTNAGKEHIFDALKGALSGVQSDTSLAQIAAALGISENAAKVAAHRLRKRYRELLRTEVGQTLENSGEIDDEIRQLFTALQT